MSKTDKKYGIKKNKHLLSCVTKIVSVTENTKSINQKHSRYLKNKIRMNKLIYLITKRNAPSYSSIMKEK